MKKIYAAIAVSVAIVSLPAFSHHAAVDMVDEDVYAMIDSLVADTPHAEMTVDDIGTMTTTTITTQTVTETENMVDDGLLDYAASLDGTTSVTISFDTDGTTTTITQIPTP